MAIDRNTALSRYVLATGQKETTQVHLIKEDDGETTQLQAECGKRLLRSSAEVEVALHFKHFNRKTCTTCRSKWPEELEDWYSDNQS